MQRQGLVAEYSTIGCGLIDDQQKVRCTFQVLSGPGDVVGRSVEVTLTPEEAWDLGSLLLVWSDRAIERR